MSTSWGFHCETCHVASPTWFNHGEKTLLEAYAKWPAIQQVLDTLEGLEYFSWEIEAYIHYQERGDSEPTLFEFLRAHGGHELALLNEYGSVREIQKEGTPCAS